MSKPQRNFVEAIFALSRCFEDQGVSATGMGAIEEMTLDNQAKRVYVLRIEIELIDEGDGTNGEF